MLKIYHVWEWIIQVPQNTGIRRKGGGGDHKLGHFNTVLSSLLAVLLGVLSTYGHPTGL